MSVRGPCAGRGGGAGASDEVQSGAVRNVSVGVGGVGGVEVGPLSLEGGGLGFQCWRQCFSVLLFALHVLGVVI